VCGCVCVNNCVTERQRARERQRERLRVPLCVGHADTLVIPADASRGGIAVWRAGCDPGCGANFLETHPGTLHLAFLALGSLHLVQTFSGRSALETSDPVPPPVDTARPAVAAGAGPALSSSADVAGNSVARAPAAFAFALGGIHKSTFPWLWASCTWNTRIS